MHVADRVQSVVGGTIRKETQAYETQLGALALWRSGALALWRSGALALWRSGALALWRSGALALWRSGALALWRSGALALWRSGALALWRSGALALWRSGALALWRSGALALWRSGALALWRSGALALWRSGALALWRSGALALWRSGALALWRSGALALWRSGALNCIGNCTHAVPCPCRDCSQTATRLNSVRGARVSGIRCVCTPCVRLLHSRRLLSLHGLRTFFSINSIVSMTFVRTILFFKNTIGHRSSKARKSIPPSALAWTAGLAGVAQV